MDEQSQITFIQGNVNALSTGTQNHVIKKYLFCVCAHRETHKAARSEFLLRIIYSLALRF